LGAARLCQAALGEAGAVNPLPLDPARQTRYRHDPERHKHYRAVHAEFTALYSQLFG
jgi:sugar (pentulose or hexulose) kinase